MYFLLLWVAYHENKGCQLEHYITWNKHIIWPLEFTSFWFYDLRYLLRNFLKTQSKTNCTIGNSWKTLSNKYASTYSPPVLNGPSHKHIPGATRDNTLLINRGDRHSGTVHCQPFPNTAKLHLSTMAQTLEEKFKMQLCIWNLVKYYCLTFVEAETEYSYQCLKSRIIPLLQEVYQL
jgi:hypothetical protein